METKANYVLVGIFTLVAIVAAFVFVYWTAGGQGATAPLRIRILGSAAGLARGSEVSFNGIKVGTVTNLHIDVSDPSIAIADAEVDRLTPITRSTKADIGIAGLSGQAKIELKGANLDEPKLLDEAEEAGKVAVITANPSAVTNLLETAQDIFTRTDTLLSNLEGFVTDVRAPLTDTIKNAQKFSQALGDNAGGVDDFLASVTKLSNQLAGASDKLDSTLDAAEGLIKSVDKEQVRNIVSNVETLSKNLSATSDQIGGVVERVDGAVKSVTAFSDGARGTLAKVDKILDGVDPATLHDTIENIGTVSKNANKVVEDISKVTSKLANRADDIDQIVADVGTLAKNLSDSSNKVGDVVKRVDGAVKSITEFSDGARQTLGEVDKILAGVDPGAVRETIGNIQEASKTANKVVEDVSKVTSKFGEHADDIDKIVADATELADRLNHASVRVDGILAKVDSLLGSDETKGLVKEASDTLKSFKQVADTLNSRLGEITDGLARFANQGLGDVDALARDARRSINRIEEAVTDLSRNPQRIISGGDGTVREYDGRARR